jgi:ribosome assembly protein RRB1
MKKKKKQKKPKFNKPTFTKRVKPSNQIIKENSQMIYETKAHQNIQDQLEFEDDYEDLYEEEQIIDTQKQMQTIEKVVPFMGTNKQLQDNQKLEFSNSGYVMYHRASTEWPCLSVDFLIPGLDSLQSVKNVKVVEDFKYPLELYSVAGSQANFDNQNQLYVMRFCDLAKTRFDDDEDTGEIVIEGQEDNKADVEPELLSERFQLFSATNRIRSMCGSPIVALMNQTGQLQIFDISKNITSLQNKNPMKSAKVEDSKLTRIVNNFQLSTEGYGLNWSPVELGLLACGTNDGILSVLRPSDETFSSFVKSDHHFKAHEKSIEDIQFSPLQAQILATSSSDNSIKLFDLRDPSKTLSSAIQINGHASDVNVISWNAINPNLLASGDDDGIIKVFDLRYPNKAPLSEIDFHVDSICSIEWQPHDEWTLAVGSLDNRISLWDLSVESDESGLPGLNQKNEEDEDIPDQLLFLHQGQEELRELRWHPVYKDLVMSTALDSFNVFQPSLDEMEQIEEEEMNLKNSPNDLILN